MINKTVPHDKSRHKTTHKEEHHLIWPMNNLILLRIEIIILPEGTGSWKTYA